LVPWSLEWGDEPKIIYCWLQQYLEFQDKKFHHRGAEKNVSNVISAAGAVNIKKLCASAVNRF
jgi:hypothetical protein